MLLAHARNLDVQHEAVELEERLRLVGRQLRHELLQPRQHVEEEEHPRVREEVRGPPHEAPRRRVLLGLGD